MSGIVGNNVGRGSGVVKAAVVGADAITGDEIADDAVDSEHYTDGSIDNAHIADDAIDSEHYAAGSIDEAHIADNAVTLAKMAGGTDGNIISYDASGDPVAIATGSDGEVLTSSGAGSPPAFEAAAGGGKLLQVVNATSTAAVNIGATEADTNLTATLTTTADDSKILVIVTQELSKSGMAVAAGHTTILNQAGSNVLTVQKQAGYNAVNSIRLDSCSFSYLSSVISSASTSVVFKTRGKHSDAGYSGNMEYGHDGSMSTMTLIEIGA